MPLHTTHGHRRLISAAYTCMTPAHEPGRCRLPLNAEDAIDSRQVDLAGRYPVFLAAFSLIWVGVLWPLDYFWAKLLSLQGPLIAPGCALAFLLCGAAIAVLRSQGRLPSWLAALALGASMYCLVVTMPTGPSLLQIPLTDYVNEAGASTFLILLSAAIYLAARGRRARRFAWYLGLGIAVGFLALRIAFIGPPGAATYNSTADMAVVLFLLAGGAVMALSAKRAASPVFYTKGILAITTIGSFVAIALWFVLTGYAKAVHFEGGWQGGLQALQAQLVLLFCLTFTCMLARSHKLASELISRSRELRHASLHDFLTDLPNKRHLAKRLAAMCRVAREKREKVHVVLFDLEGVKLINDSMGHAVGDVVLKEVARRIVERAGPNAFVARLEGDEFVLAFTGQEDETIRTTTQELLDAIGRSYQVHNAELRVSASAGITASDGRISLPLELVSQADLAVTRAKRDGGRTWYEYCVSLRKEVTERLAMSVELQNALENDTLCLHYQPVVDGHTGRIVGAEALLRWLHSDYGLISPSMFIPLAEETGQIVPLSLWVLDRACRDVLSLRQRSACDFPVLINISPLYFHRSDFVADIEAALTRYALPPESLQIEITEGVLLDSAQSTISKLARLKELGVKVSIDDFGTGYSSLNYLKNLPIDKIKIDRSFVNEVISDRHDAAITKAIIGLAHHLNLKVVAEGVETESQYWFLKRNFCDEFQGYFFDRPMAWEDFSRRLHETGGRVALPQAFKQPESTRTLLIVDDEENILRALTRLLRRDGYNIVSARSPAEAFAILASQEVQVILSDQRMPGMTGTEFFSRIKQMYPRTVRLILSGYTELKTVTEAINHGAIYRYLTKPWDDQELRDQVSDAFKVLSQPVPTLIAEDTA